MRTILWTLPVRILRVLLGKTVFVRSGSLCRFLRRSFAIPLRRFSVLYFCVHAEFRYSR